MVVTNTGKNRIRDLIAQDSYNASFGTDNTTPTVDDTDLIAKDSNTTHDVVATTSDRTVNIKHILLSTDANGVTLKEFGVYLNNGADLLDRVVFPDLDKTSSEEIHTIITLRIE